MTQIRVRTTEPVLISLTSLNVIVSQVMKETHVREVGQVTCPIPTSTIECHCCHMLSAETDECGSSPCQNGATCVDAFLSFTCICIIGYEGIMCETSSCGIC